MVGCRVSPYCQAAYLGKSNHINFIRRTLVQYTGISWVSPGAVVCINVFITFPNYQFRFGPKLLVSFLHWQGYGVSKVLAEKEAFKYGEENNLSVVTMLPTLTIGPFLMPTLNISIALSLSLLTGKRKQRRKIN